MTFRKPKRATQCVQVSFSTLGQWLMHDIGLPDRDRLCQIMDIIPVSDEVDAMEHAASDVRLTRVVPIAEIIESYSGMVAKLTAEAMTSDGFVDDSKVRQFHAVSQAAITAFLAAFMELGLIVGMYPGADGDE